ncbi:hypothetical protein KRR23_28885 [Pseudomonas sp. CVAP|uniref:hypothetical protein n=1 Tax=Pseudomonas sp. CVAP\|nr:hypothetical protein [Pseudomonas sp. CVAP\
MGDFTKEATKFDEKVKSCIEDHTCKVSSSSNWRPGQTVELGESIINDLPRNAGEASLDQVVKVLKLTHEFPAEQIQAIALTVQAVMGPLKMVVSVAANAAIKQTVGDKIDEIKEAAAIELAAKVVDRTPEFMAEEHAKAKKEPVDGLAGDKYVLASEFLIDAILGEVKSLGMKAGGRIIQVTGEKPSPEEVLGGAHRDTSKPVNDKLDSGKGDTHFLMGRLENQRI